MKKLSVLFGWCILSLTLPLTPTWAAGFEPILDESALNPSIDPCTDFYSFACGGWEARVKIPNDESRWARSFSTIDEQNLIQLRGILEAYAAGDFSLPSTYSQKLGEFYSSCMNEKSAETATLKLLPKELASIEQIGNEKSLTAGIAELQQKGINVLFSIGPSPDQKDSSQMIAVIDQGGLGLPNRDYYFERTLDKIKIRREYRNHIAQMLKLSGTPKSLAKQQARIIFNFEKELARNALAPQDRRDPNKLYHPVGRKELEEWAPGISWKDYFSLLQLAEVTRLNVNEPEFIKGLGRLVTKTRPEVIRAYLKWHFLRTTGDTLGKPLVDESFRFYGSILRGQKRQKPRWKTCVNAADSLYRDALGEAFVKKTFGEEGKAKALEILNNIQLTFERNLHQIDWMDDATRKLAVQKLKVIRNKIGFPEKWNDLSNLTTDRQFYFRNALSAMEFWKVKDLKKVGLPVDRLEWYMTPPQVNAYYSAELNEIAFPAGILQPPFFSTSAIRAANYGAIGMVIGHELTHGFDDEGRKFDSQGNLKEWWSPSVADVFTKKAQCLVDQYSKYKVAGDTPINGKLTLGENIADLGGLKIAYYAYLGSLSLNDDKMETDGRQEGGTVAGLSNSQKFFVSHAQSWCAKTTPEAEKLRASTDPHAPPQYRVNGVVVNLPEFSQAFGCKTATPMSPVNRCSIW